MYVCQSIRKGERIRTKKKESNSLNYRFTKLRSPKQDQYKKQLRTIKSTSENANALYMFMCTWDIHQDTLYLGQETSLNKHPRVIITQRIFSDIVESIKSD